MANVVENTTAADTTESRPYRIITDKQSGRHFRVGESPKSLIGLNRWVPVLASWGCMCMAGVLEYAWGALSGSLEAQHGWGLAGVFWIFSVFTIFESVVSHPVTSYFREHNIMSVRVLCMIGGLLCGIVALLITAFSPLLWLTYIGYGVIGGFGAGIIYNSCISMSSKWYPEKKGMRTGFVDGGYTYGSVPWIIAIGFLGGKGGLGDFTQTFIWIIGVCITGVIIIAAFFLHDPPKHWWPEGVDPIDFQKSKRARMLKANPPAQMQMTPAEMWRTPAAKWVTLQFILFAACSLFSVAFYFPFGKAMQLGTAAVVAGGAGFALANGVGRAFFGFVGDLIGRKRTMMGTYLAGAILMILVFFTGMYHRPILFAICAVLSGLVAGTGFTLTATIVPDYWGANHNAQNYATVYSWKTLAGIVGGGVAAMVVAGGFGVHTGHEAWLHGFALGACLLFVGFLVVTFMMKRPTLKQMVSARERTIAAAHRKGKIAASERDERELGLGVELPVGGGSEPAHGTSNRTG